MISIAVVREENPQMTSEPFRRELYADPPFGVQ